MFDKVDIIYKDVKNFQISVNQHGGVAVISPLNISKKSVLDLLQSKKSWIEKRRDKVLSNKKYNYSLYDLGEGDNVFFLGKKNIVRLMKSEQNVILEKQGTLEFFLNVGLLNDRSFKLKLLEEFYKDRADIIFNNLVAKYLKITNQDIQKVVIKKTKTRWGSCNYLKKIINLNLDLVLRDVAIIEYVILHEIAHLTYPNHSKGFYSYVASYMPDWKAREKQLN